ISVSLADIVARLLRRNPDERPGNAREVIALINEKLGRAYPYETPQSRAAYLNSSAYHPYTTIQEKIDVSSGKPVVITAEPRMGLRSFLNDIAGDFEKRGVPVQRFSGDEWKDANPPSGIVSVFGPLKTMPDVLPETASLIVGIETEEPNDLAAFQLPHLDIRDTEDMLQTIFGQHCFPKNFAENLWERTLGHVGAAHEILQELLNHDLIDVGIEGWEWYGSETDWPLPESLLQLWQSRFQKLDSLHRRALAFLAFTFNHTLPKDVWNSLCDISLEEQAAFADSLCKRGWIDIGETVALRTPIHTSAIRSSLPMTEAREIHERLSELPPPSHEAIAEMTCYIGHQLLSPTPKLSSGEAFTKLRQCIKQGQAKTVAELSTEAIEMIPNISTAWKAVLLLLFAESTALAGSLSRAQEAAQRAVDVAREATLPGEVAEGQLLLAHILERQGEWDEAEKHLSDCYEKAPFLPKERMMILLSTWAWTRFRKGDIEKAGSLAQQALAQGGEAAEKLGRLRQTLGNLAYFRGDLDSAAREWEAALKDYEEHADARGKSDVHNNLGVIAARRSKPELAREHWETCKKLSEQTGNQARVAGLLNNLAISAFEEGDFRQAEKNYEEALRIYRKLDAPRERIEILNNLGELSFYRANYPRARAFWNEALSDADALGDVEAQIEPLIYLGKLSLAVGAQEESQRFFEKAISTAREVSNEPGLARALGEFALYQMHSSDLEKANRLLDEADSTLHDDADPALKLNLFFARLQLLLAAEEKENAADLYASVKALPEAMSTFVARAHLGLLGLAQGQTLPDNSWFADIHEFPEFSWRASWYQAQKLLTNQDRKSILREVEKAAASLRMIAEQLSEKERGSYLQSGDVVRFQKWVKEVI
ncbi:tetratricopeptide repeat protein, partial [bacterium]|nr:tetratricopeptide repeat protein [bacterium]